MVRNKNHIDTGLFKVPRILLGLGRKSYPPAESLLAQAMKQHTVDAGGAHGADNPSHLGQGQRGDELRVFGIAIVGGIAFVAVAGTRTGCEKIISQALRDAESRFDGEVLEVVTEYL